MTGVLPRILRSGCALLLAWLILPPAAGEPPLALSPEQRPLGPATWYVDGAAVDSGDGKTPETAVQTIPQGLELAKAGDTVLVAPGVYTETSLPGEDGVRLLYLVIPPGVSLVGAGAGESILEADGYANPILELEQNSRLEGFTVRPGTNAPWGRAVIVDGGGAAVLHNRIERMATGISVECDDASACRDPITVAFNVIDGVADVGILVAEPAVAVVRSNTICAAAGEVFSPQGVWLYRSDSVVEGNAIVGGYEGVVCREVAAAVAHNNVDGSPWAYGSVCAQGPGNTESASLLRDPAGGDFRPTAGSPLRGRGVPAGSDIGALPFLPAGEAPASVTVTAIGGHQVRVDWASTGAGRYDVFVAGDDGVYARRYAVTAAPPAAPSAVVTLSSPLRNMIAVSSVGDDGAASELTAMLYAPPILLDASVEQDSELLWFDGDWQTVENAGASGGSYAASTGSSAQVRAAFAGDSIVVGRRVGPGGGYAEVVVDGTACGMLKFDFPEERWRVPATLSGFGPGVHLLTLAPSRHQPEAGSTINVDFLTAPSPFVASAAQVQAVDQINWHRSVAGLQPARGVAALHQEAQAHSEYYAANRDDPRLAGLGFHKEHPDLPGFTGTSSWDRAAYFGYGYGVSEDGHFLGDPIRSVDGWMATVYHRNLILCYGCTDAGYGMVARWGNSVNTLNMGGPGQQPQERLIYTYPASNQSQVPRSWDGSEIPDPLPGRPKPVGYPISLYLAQPAQGTLAAAPPSVRDVSAEQESSPLWSVSAAELRTAGGELIPIYMLDQNTDIPKYLGPDVVFLIAERPLAKDTTYFAHVAGTDSRGVPFDYRWAFSTGAAVAAPDFAGSQIWVTPPVPGAGDTITYHVRLANSGPRAEAVTVRATLPPGTVYVAGSARTSQGTVTGTVPLESAIGNLDQGSSAELDYAVTVPEDAELPALLEAQVEVQWNSGQMKRQSALLAGGQPLYLPVTFR